MVLSSHQHSGKSCGGQNARRNFPPAGGRDKIWYIPFLPLRRDEDTAPLHQRRHAGYLHDPLPCLLTASGGEQRLKLRKQRPPLCQNRHAAALILGNISVFRQRPEGVGQRRAVDAAIVVEHIKAGRIIQQIEPR